MNTPRIDKVTAEYQRKGKCASCKRPVVRTRSFSGATLEECEEQATVWAEETALLHKKCEDYA